MRKKNYYILSDGWLRRKENTIYFENEDGRRPIPVNAIHSIYALGSLSITSGALSLFSKEGICIHFFNRYGFYEGSFYPRESLISGDLLVKQVEHYLDEEKRRNLARAFVEGAILNMGRNLSNYGFEENFLQLLEDLKGCSKIEEIMGIEAIARNRYYSHFDEILKMEFGARSRRPPKNEVNAMISFGNSLLYSSIISEIYHTQLNPTISYLHEPSERRFSLALDISEVFKPIIVDRLIFNLVNKRIVKEEDFNSELEGVLLNEEGKRKFIKAFNEKLEQTIKHRKLKRNVSYQRLMRLECYKLVKHFFGAEEYRPLVAWW